MPIEASLCSACNRAIVPPRSICPYCGTGSQPMAKTQLNDNGSILSYSLLQMPPEGFESPLLLALIELEHGAVVLSMGDSQEAGDISIGSSVNLKRDEIGRFRFSLNK